MFKQKIFIASFVVLVIVAVFNYIGIKFSLYWVYRWYDTPMHMLGGLWVSLFSLSLYTYFYKISPNIFCNIKVSYMLFFVLLIITTSWEIFELLGHITFVGDRGYWPDTLHDILNAYIGGIFAYIFFIKNNKENIELLVENNNIKK